MRPLLILPPGYKSVLFWMAILIITLIALGLMLDPAPAHDKTHPVTPQQKSWFDSLKSNKGPCCADADGNVLQDSDWESKDGHYRVFIEGQWFAVPDEAVLKQPNMYGPTMVWGYPIRTTKELRYEILCFIPGMMT